VSNANWNSRLTRCIRHLICFEAQMVCLRRGRVRGIRTSGTRHGQQCRRELLAISKSGTATDSATLAAKLVMSIPVWVLADTYGTLKVGVRVGNFDTKTRRREGKAEESNWHHRFDLQSETPAGPHVLQRNST